MSELVEIYALVCPDTGNIRYIGKANNSKNRLKSHLRDAYRRNTPLYLWIRDIGKKNKRPKVVILETTLDWVESERRLIKEYREKGVGLLNVSQGGNQPCCSKETRAMSGRKTAARIHSDPALKRIWGIKQALMSGYKRGDLSDAVKQKLLYIASKRPDLFSCFEVMR